MRVFSVVVCLALLAACATKRYGRQFELTNAEREHLTCEQLDIEIAKTQGFMDEINGQSFDDRDVLGILGDLGIGNAMERSDALKSAQRRMAQLQEQKRAKDCPGALPAPPPAPTSPPQHDQPGEVL